MTVGNISLVQTYPVSKAIPTPILPSTAMRMTSWLVEDKSAVASRHTDPNRKPPTIHGFRPQ